MANGPFWMIIPGERIGTSNGYADASAETSRMYPQPNCATVNSMADKYIIMLQVLETKKEHDLDLATKVSVQLQLTDPDLRARDRVVKKSEKDGFYTALDVGCVWLERALASK